MKKLFAIMAFTLMAFSLFAVAQETGATGSADAEVKAEARADAQLPAAEIAKPMLHSVFIAAAQGIGVDAADSSNFVLLKATVGRVALTKKFAQESNGSENADDEVRCNPGGKCRTVRKTGILAVTSANSTARYHLKNIVAGEGTVSAELFNDKESTGSITLSLTTLAGEAKVWAGKATIGGKQWNAYLPFRAHAKLVTPVMKTENTGHKCGLIRPLEAGAIRECVQAGGKAVVKTVDGCPRIECAKPSARPISSLTAGLKAKCDAKGGTLVRKPVRDGKKPAGFKIVCVVKGEVAEESAGSTEETASATPSASVTATPSPSASASASQLPSVSASPTASATATATPTPSATTSPSASAQASASASVAAGTR